ncbi:uncharacterized protein B0H18DRAFT_283759 [Fomitopsis serialis]|uniref:uncharacterized protein n=1 Tax=Fomitopsis serialis TaxID=139415 RepID=UPI00200874B9|nr:uncharacterized protein B0H18DRAFT_283759 [Neoantrodia serialis]KAH9927667.1 hypothetical protein B0H18DRAFT_283759 [Neoantrodia serialis]
MDTADGVDIGPHLGAFILGIWLNTLLYGVVVSGYYHYAFHSQKDPWPLRLFIVFLFVADTAQTGLSVVYAYTGLVTHFGGSHYLSTPGIVSTSLPAITGIISCSVELFFTYRVYAISHSIWLSAFIPVLAVASMLCAIGSVIAIRWPGMSGIESLQRPVAKGLVSTWLVTGVVADILITVSLVWHLHRRKSGFSSTDSLVNQIIRLTVQTGVLTTTWAILDLALYLASPRATHLFFNISLAKLYTILLISSLNHRGTWETPSSNQLADSCHSWGVESRPATETQSAYTHASFV